MRANVCYLKNDMTKAIEYIETFNANYVYYYEGYNVALTLYVEGKQFEKALRVLDLMIEQFEFTKEELKSSVEESFPEFDKRKDFISWSKT